MAGRFEGLSAPAWQLVADIFPPVPPPRGRGRPHTPCRQVVNTLWDVRITGCRCGTPSTCGRAGVDVPGNGRRLSPPLQAMMRKTSVSSCAPVASERRYPHTCGRPRSRAVDPARWTCRVSKRRGPSPGFRRSTVVWSSVGSVWQPAWRRFFPWPRSISGSTGS
jgi:hypothetical protein